MELATFLEIEQLVIPLYHVIEQTGDRSESRKEKIVELK